MTDSAETTYGRVVVSQALGSCALGQVALGHEQPSNLAAVVFVFAPEQCSDSDRRWMVVRQLRPRPDVVGTMIVEVQSSPTTAFVTVAWPGATMQPDPAAIPPELGEVIANFLSGSLTIGALLAKLSELEPRRVPATVAINAKQFPPVWPTKSEVVAPPAVEPASAVVSPIADPPVAQAANETAPVYGQTLFLQPGEKPPTAPSEPPARRASPSNPPARRASPALGSTTSAAARKSAIPTPPKAWQVPAPLLWVGPSILVLVVLLIIWAVTKDGKQPPPPPPPVPAPTVEAAPPKPLPAPVVVAPPVAQPRPQPDPQQQEAAAPEASEENSNESEEVVLQTSPAGAQVCDPRSHKVLGTTPLTLARGQIRHGHKLVLTAPGFKLAELRWPPKRKVRLVPLGRDEAHPVSPCAF